MHPYPRLRRYFSRRGKFALLSASELISISRHKGAKTSPSREDAAAGGRRGAFPSPVRAVGLFSSGRSPVVWFSLSCCHKLKLSPLPSTHSPTALAGWQRNWIYRGASRPENPVTCFPAGQRWWRQPPKGDCCRQAAFYTHRRQAIPQPSPLWYYVPPFPRKRWHNEPSGRKPRQSLEPFPLACWNTAMLCK